MAGYEGAPGRSLELARGAFGDPAGQAPGSSGEDSGLTLSAAQFNRQASGGARPTSVLQPLSSNPGGNGMSAGDAARRTIDGQYLGSVNGTSESSFEPAAYLRLTSQDGE
jgi:hypothetical protein